MSVSFYMNPDKKGLVWSVSLKLSALLDMYCDKKYVVLLSINSLKVSELFHMNSKIIQLFSKFCIFVNLLKTDVFYSH